MLPFIAIVLVTWFLIATFPIWFGLTMGLFGAVLGMIGALLGGAIALFVLMMLTVPALIALYVLMKVFVALYQAEPERR
ncbi:hypothetical protein [Rhizobium oryzicola]|uniref:Uncharacterized protein n=1 Tax=Rhizobium oryzicola TaxID=1232668 RepID=A0ABT8SWB8_9HYPH|nr:hypothetical protein [Rhizobium oryzicola]MDO1582318.1 hypothetical protein [Rhizobium oryzicola]